MTRSLLPSRLVQCEQRLGKALHRKAVHPVVTWGQPESANIPYALWSLQPQNSIMWVSAWVLDVIYYDANWWSPWKTTNLLQFSSDRDDPTCASINTQIRSTQWDQPANRKNRYALYWVGTLTLTNQSKRYMHSKITRVRRSMSGQTNKKLFVCPFSDRSKISEIRCRGFFSRHFFLHVWFVNIFQLAFYTCTCRFVHIFTLVRNISAYV